MKLLIHLFGCWRGSLRPPLLERRAARPTRPGSRSCAASAPRELSHPSAEPPRPTGAVSSRRACVSSSFGGCNPAPPCARTGWSCCDPLFRGSPHDGSTDGKPCNQWPRTQISSEEHTTRTCRQKLPKRPHPGLSNFPCPPPVHIRTYIAHLGQFAIVIAYLFP